MTRQFYTFELTPSEVDLLLDLLDTAVKGKTLKVRKLKIVQRIISEFDTIDNTNIN